MVENGQPTYGKSMYIFSLIHLRRLGLLDVYYELYSYKFKYIFIRDIFILCDFIGQLKLNSVKYNNFHYLNCFRVFRESKYY